MPLFWAVQTRLFLYWLASRCANGAFLGWGASTTARCKHKKKSHVLYEVQPQKQRFHQLGHWHMFYATPEHQTNHLNFGKIEAFLQMYAYLKLIASLYHDQVRLVQGRQFPIKRGVKQGDVLSPLLEPKWFEPKWLEPKWLRWRSRL